MHIKFEASMYSNVNVFLNLMHQCVPKFDAAMYSNVIVFLNLMYFKIKCINVFKMPMYFKI